MQSSALSIKSTFVCGVQNAVQDAEQLRRLVEAERYVLELSGRCSHHPGSQHHSAAPPPAIACPSAYSARRTSAPAVCGSCSAAADGGLEWRTDSSRLRSQSLSSSGSSPAAADLSFYRRLDRLVAGCEYVDPGLAMTVAETFIFRQPAFDDVIPLDVRQRIDLLLHSRGILRAV